MRGPYYLLKLVLGLAAAGIAAAGGLRADLALVQREAFQGVGTLNAAMPGNLGAVYGASSFYKRAVGPRLAGDTTASSLGWSADLRLGAGSRATGRHDFAISGAAQAAGMFSAWYRVDELIPNGSHACAISSPYLGDGTQLLLMILDTVTGDFWYNRHGLWADTDSGIAVPLHQWFELRVEWLTVGKDCAALSADFRLAGAAAWTNIYTSAAFTMTGVPTLMSGGSLNSSGSAAGFRGRYGMPGLYTMAAWADRLLPIGDVSDPPTAPVTWHVDPVNGDDANDGVSAATAWRTVDKIDAESQYGGLLATADGYAAGDTLVVDTTLANLFLGPSALTLTTRGLNLVQRGGGEIQAWTSLPAASWSLAAGAARTYQHTLTENNPSIVAWEDDRWLNHVTGAALGSPSSGVLAALEGTPGSFWTDGTTLYLHPFGDTNPAADGKTYTRSYNRAGSNAAAVQLLVPDLHVDGLRVRKTTLADASTNDPGGAYCVQTNGAAGGTTLIENCACSYGSKHIFGFTDSSTARRLTVRNCTADQGSPYAGAGGQTPWVDYSSLAGDADNQTTYTNCSTTATSGLIGSTAGQTLTSFLDAWLSHNNGTGRQFSLLRFVDCRFDTPLMEGGSAAAGAVQLSGTTCGGLAVNSAGATVDRSKSTAYPFISQVAGSGIAVTNSVVAASGRYVRGGSTTACAGSVSYVGCTVDMRGAVNGDGTAAALLYRKGALDLTWRNNVFLGAGSNPVIDGATSTDTLSFSHNAYQGAKVLGNYGGPGDLTLAQWQALGQDAGSLAAADLGVQADGSLSPTSPAIDLGQDLGPATDYTGAAFPIRNDAGAFEYPLPALRAAPAPAQATEGASVVLSVRTAGNGPFDYQWFCNGAPVPGGNGSTLTLANALPGQSGSYSVVVTNAGGSVTAGPAAVGIVPAAFPAWQGSRFTPAELLDPAVSGPLADPDGDGLGNFLEYAFGGDPRRADLTACAPRASMLADVDGTHPAITYRRLINAVSVVYTVESSPDLDVWTAADAPLTGAPRAAGDLRTEWVTARLAAPVGNGPGERRFLRLRVSGG